MLRRAARCPSTQAPLFARALFSAPRSGFNLLTHSAPDSSQRRSALVGLAPTGSAPLSPLRGADTLRTAAASYSATLLARGRALPLSLVRSTGRPHLGEAGAIFFLATLASCRGSLIGRRAALPSSGCASLVGP